ncbi:MAG TPA: phosphatase [Opitutus sp.]|nr:phosphatase [Opitutus sp.]
MSSPRVAIIDIGSNSIKVLVAERDARGQVSALLNRTLDARISAGISQNKPFLTDESMNRGIAAITELLADAAPHAPQQTVLVATSAVRDADNGPEFRKRVHAATGWEIRILSGSEEANAIGRGLTCDPALAGLADFYVFDLGGGSLECLSFRARQIESVGSLQLGCVRLTEQLVPDPWQPIPLAELTKIQKHTRATLAASGFTFRLPPDATTVGTGGTITTVRALLAAREGMALEQTDTNVQVTELRSMMDQLAALSLEERKKVPGLPPGRADVFPTALATLIAIAEFGGFTAYRHSFYNLRYGLAAETLDGM